jgi:hypothetical protein
MKQIVYAMQFKGTAAPKAGVPSVIKASTSASSCTITSAIGDDGLTGTILPAAGGKASFESEVTVLDETAFNEVGTIRFGDSNHLLRFSTVGQGYLGGTLEASLQHGSVMWRVEGGDGQFDGASGLITSNFTLSATAP